MDQQCCECFNDAIIPGSENFGYASEQLFIQDDVANTIFQPLSRLGFDTSIFSLVIDIEKILIITIPDWVKCCVVNLLGVTFKSFYIRFTNDSPCSTYFYSPVRIFQPPISDFIKTGIIVNVVCYSNSNHPRPAPGLSLTNSSIAQLTIILPITAVTLSPIETEILFFSNSAPGKLFFRPIENLLYLLQDTTYGNCISGTYWFLLNSGESSSFNFEFRLSRNATCPLPFYNAPDWSTLFENFTNRFGQPLKFITFILPDTINSSDIRFIGINYIIQ